MSDDFRGPIGRVVRITPLIQDAGILLDMDIRYPGEAEGVPLSREAVLVPANLGRELSEELSTAVVEWVRTYRRE